MMDPEDIKAGLRKSFGSVIAFEQAQKLPAKSVTDVIRGRSNARVEKAVAVALGLKPQVIWPSRYNKDGSRMRLSGVDNYRASARLGNPA